jgi:methionyl-tRNA formyltransferase
MDNIVLITQGSQAISLVRTLFSLGYKPDQILVFTDKDEKNNCFREFLTYYNIVHYLKINMSLIKDNDLVISYSNLHKIKVNNKATFINFHPGLLPKYKGSLSTVHSLINGEKKVGGTWHYMTNKIDCGNILYKFKIKIKKKDTAFSLNHKIFNKSLNCLKKVLNKVKLNNKGKVQKPKGKFYYNKFPDVSKLDNFLQKRITYFPPKFI